MILSGCAPSVDPIERLGKKAAQKVHPSRGPHEEKYRDWGLAAPVTRAPRPVRSPGHGAGPAGPGLPPALDHVPTHDKVVFLTYGADAEKDPRFIDMVRELRLPVSVFLADSSVGPEYARAARLRAAGASIENLTLHHAELRGLSYRAQRAEICGQQERLRVRLGGLHPRLLRPPYGTYDRTTFEAAADCGITSLILWRRTPGRNPDAYERDAPLRPGDILRPHVQPHEEESRPPAPLTTETARLLRRIQESGFTVGRLEDYL
ncbi:polysaccharide deacetylase family protein [Streptomyces sp. NPDC052051]|uniref:polysaccharide deacetylase family protein n=1 Tax=Streptomyces sp. NPDC052051 TaxID=3154649 RepID=UPI00341A0E44